ncbi:MAG TPA: TylF/MycF/NovP-related O-methyltransferase [Ktedonobacteraceae bacterium]|nr:TylF/MycF/NovP-related O-methyltransferase [Ktedonobacteraceae bacterium]
MSPKKFLCLLVEDRALAPRLRLLRLAGRVLVPSYRFKWPQLQWWQNKLFTNYLDRFGELSVLNTDRKWMVYQLLRLTAHLTGDTAECGVFRGATSYLICRANQESAHPKMHHIFDSFEGLSQPSTEDGVHWSKGDLGCSLSDVQKRLSQFDQVAFYPGWIPDRFAQVNNRRFSFVHIDVDLAEPTRQSLEFFYPRMEPGGIIVCDDYGMTICAGATNAVDRFLADKKEKMISLSDGGGFLVVGRETSMPVQL